MSQGKRLDRSETRNDYEESDSLMKNYMTRFQAALPLYLSLSGFFPLSFFLSAQIRQENKNDWENWIKESFIENGKCKERKNERKTERKTNDGRACLKINFQH